MDQRDDAELIRRMSDGFADALTMIYERHSPAVYRFAFHMSGSRDVANEITQETFLTLIESAGEYDGSRAPLQAWLIGVTRNLVRRKFDSQRDFEPITDLDPVAEGCDPLAELSRAESIENVRQAVLTLPEPYREVVVLCELQEMDYREAAAALRCPVGTIRSRLHRARLMLLAKLRNGCPV